MPKVKVSLLVDDESLPRLDDVVKQVKGVGMDVEQVLARTGVVTGSVEPERLNKLSRVKGVLRVEEERQFHIAPPESDLQ